VKKWKCNICGYIHEGDEPPETCPVCGAERSAFVEIVEEASKAEEPEAAEPEELRPSAGPPTWKCNVCGYIHKGDEPPETCPVCGADRSEFVEIAEEAPKVVEPKAAEPRPSADPPTQTGFYGAFTDLMTKHHAHPISVHIPNGVAPVAVIFMVLAIFFRMSALEPAAFYNMIVVALSMPMVLFSGYVDWQKRFGGNLTSIFIIKIICGVLVTVAAFIIVGWRITDPEVAGMASPSRWIYLSAHLVLLGAAITAGYCGGRLVFHYQD
jgi:rubredoxin